MDFWNLSCDPQIKKTWERVLIGICQDLCLQRTYVESFNTPLPLSSCQFITPWNQRTRFGYASNIHAPSLRRYFLLVLGVLTHKSGWKGNVGGLFPCKSRTLHYLLEFLQTLRDVESYIYQGPISFILREKKKTVFMRQNNSVQGRKPSFVLWLEQAQCTQAPCRTASPGSATPGERVCVEGYQVHPELHRGSCYSQLPHHRFQPLTLAWEGELTKLSGKLEAYHMAANF